ncbi:MAG: DUF1700 domain-containing protein [Lachnospiraceae bacterium]|nr:DUF1700 domain-containing protein [Lachnospiraceae bacterium]
MNKEMFLAKLRMELYGLPAEDIEERIAFYSEMIDDRVEEGLSEEEAVAQIGPMEDIVSQTISDIPLTKLVKEKIKPDRSLKGWEIALIIISFPIWFPLLIAAGAIIFSFYAVIWALVISAWAVAVSLVAAGIGGTVAGIVNMVCGHPLSGLAMLGMSLFSAGLGIFAFLACVGLTKGAAKLTARIALGIKSLFIKKEH